jgi:hypothetical protein
MKAHLLVCVASEALEIGVVDGICVRVFFLLIFEQNDKRKFCKNKDSSYCVPAGK